MSAIDDKYAALGGAKSILREPLVPETTTPDGVGHFRHYQDGSIYWHPSTGAHMVRGAIRQKWASLGWERSPLGYPTTDETATPDKKGFFTHFQGGSIYWHPATGAHVVQGAIREKWASLGWERSPLGYPTTDETATPDKKGFFTHFQGGSIYWHPTTGAHVVQGAIRDLWASNGWEATRFGFPVTDEEQMNAQDNGRFTRFEKGTVCWTPKTHAWADYHGGDSDGRFSSSLTLFRDSNFAGPSHAYTVDTDRPIVFYQTLRADGLNDKVSSLKVAGLPAHCSVYLYDKDDFDGRWVRVRGGQDTQVAALGKMNECISSVMAVNHGMASILIPEASMQQMAQQALGSFKVSGVKWNGGPRIYVQPERRLRVRLQGVIEQTWPDSDLDLSVYFRLFITGPTSITARYDGWQAHYGGSFAGYANGVIGDKLKSFLDNTNTQAMLMNTLNLAFARQLQKLEQGAVLDINLRRLNFLPDGVEVVITDNEAVVPVLEALKVEGLSSPQSPGEVTYGTT
jgi:hypothetical protein